MQIGVYFYKSIYTAWMLWLILCVTRDLIKRNKGATQTRYFSRKFKIINNSRSALKIALGQAPLWGVVRKKVATSKMTIRFMQFMQFSDHCSVVFDGPLYIKHTQGKNTSFCKPSTEAFPTHSLEFWHEFRHDVSNPPRSRALTAKSSFRLNVERNCLLPRVQSNLKRAKASIFNQSAQ